ncbi:MAG: RdgB/HAM1 family non-canonical purine NTP pyrophosphatase [Phycisphaeraceae bacterium]|nr:RdgB/HAM1 family non-canonical purine NTP pyrophosphatase [Phycisphaeraceae bacterium]
MTSDPIVLATANPHKVEELREIFALAGVPVVGLADLSAPAGGFREPEESGTTFEANAAIKAASYARQTGRTCLADDSGLMIDALNGRPGVISSHYSTDGRETGASRAERDRQNNERVLRELAGVEPERRTARFVCVMALAGADGSILATSRGAFEGRIGIPPRVPSGTNGFGYDPLFLVAPGFSQTGAELDAAEKNRVSHRSGAAREMALLLRSMRNR